MSHQATAWALDRRRTGKLAPSARLVLVALADYAGPDGRHAFPALSTIAERLDIDQRQVRRHVSTLKRLGLITPGDESHVAAYPAYARPNVWDLLIDGPDSVIHSHPRSSTPPRVSEGHTPGCDGAIPPGVDDLQTKNLTTHENTPPTPRVETASCSRCDESRPLVADGMCRRCVVAVEQGLA